MFTRTRRHLEEMSLETFTEQSRAEQAGNTILTLEIETKRKTIDHADEIACLCRSLAEKLEKIANRIDDHPLTPGAINSLGEVQSAGLDIDRECALWSQSLHHYIVLHSLNSKS